MRQSNAGSILTVMGFHDSEGEVPLITDEDIHPNRRGHEFCVNVFDLVQVMIKLSWNKRKFAREHCGFCMKEVAEYKQIFRTADSEDTGELHSGQVVRLLELLFPEMSGDPIVRQQLSQIVKDAYMNGNSHLDLKDFLHLMRTCANLQIKARHDKERHAIQETAFSPAEISDFRHIFLAADVDNSQELSLQEFRKMMGNLCPMGAKNSELLSTIFFRITNRQCQVEGSHDHADFAEFMWLWHHLLETNFGGIRETTEKAKELKAKKEQHALANMGRRRSSVRVVIATGS
jgi:Ca2+-binding EF-hand superfamily protein